MVVVYPVFLLGLPLTLIFPLYPALLLVPAWRNRPRGVPVLVDHLVYGGGVLAELVAPMKILVFPRDPESLSEPAVRRNAASGRPGHATWAADALSHSQRAAAPAGDRGPPRRRRTPDSPALGFGFALPGARRFPVMRWRRRSGSSSGCGACRVLGMRLVWTAHNVCRTSRSSPMSSARRALVGASDLVLAHSPLALDELAASVPSPAGAPSSRHGPISARRPRRCCHPGADRGPRRFLFFGRVQEYKGVDDLLTAFLALPAERRRADRRGPVR